MTILNIAKICGETLHIVLLQPYLSYYEIQNVIKFFCNLVFILQLFILKSLRQLIFKLYLKWQKSFVFFTKTFKTFRILMLNSQTFCCILAVVCRWKGFHRMNDQIGATKNNGDIILSTKLKNCISTLNTLLNIVLFECIHY